MRISEVGYSKINTISNSNSIRNDFVNFKANSDTVELSADKESKNKIWPYVLGGLAAVAAIIYAVKKHKTPDINPKESLNVTEMKPASALDIKPETNAGVLSSPPLGVKPENNAGSLSSTPLSVKTETNAGVLNSAPRPWMLSKEEMSQIVVNPTKENKIRLRVEQQFVESNDINEVIEKIMGSIYSGNMSVDRKVAREVLPTLIKNDEGLHIGGHYERFLGCLHEDNKDFAIENVVPWLVKNYKKSGLKDSYNNCAFMDGIGPEELKIADRLVNVSKDLGLDHHSEFFSVIDQSFIKGEAFIFDEVIPTIIKNREQLLNPNSHSTVELVKILTPQNIKRVFGEDLPAILSNKERLRLDNESGGSVVDILLSINQNGKDFILNDALPLIEKNMDKLKLENNSYSISNLLKNITPENRANLHLIIDNAEKLGVKNRYDAAFMIKDKSKEELMAIINS